ncbi:MAG: hypothetical protein KGH53_03120 [Candidatus Micrarchaeota archaeon]|nr:hypothetical protein [Candidatus Micrarchaeota archaeon]
MKSLQREYPKAEKIFELLSKKDAIAIFVEASKGFAAKIDSNEKIGMSRKQYYVRLAQLVDAGLIEKSKEVYEQTAFGKAVYNKHFLGMKALVRDVRKYQMEDVLRKSNKFNKSDIDEVFSGTKEN